MKNKKIASQFPNIYRTITESFFAKKLKKSKLRLIWQSKLKKPVTMISAVLVFIVVVLLSTEIALLGFNIYKSSVLYRQISVQRQSIEGQINFWQSAADKYAGYKDAYFKMALLEYQLGDFQKARDENQKALLLDPNFNDAIKLEAILTKK